MTSYLYVIAHPNGLRKIGFSNAPERRLEELRKRIHPELRLEARAKCSAEERHAERCAHQALSKRRFAGEWFDVDADTAADAIRIAAEKAPSTIPDAALSADLILNDDGTVTLPRSTYDDLIAIASLADDDESFEGAVKALSDGADELIPQEFADRLIDGENPLRVYRELRGLTQSALANASGVNRVQIINSENDGKAGSVETARKLADALSVQIDDLVA